jgi:hypothetical protein
MTVNFYQNTQHNIPEDIIFILATFKTWNLNYVYGQHRTTGSGTHLLPQNFWTYDMWVQNVNFLKERCQYADVMVHRQSLWNTVTERNQQSLVKLHKIGNVYSLEHNEILKLFSMPHHGQCPQQINKGNSNCRNGIKSKKAIVSMSSEVIQHCNPATTLIEIAQ